MSTNQPTASDLYSIMVRALVPPERADMDEPERQKYLDRVAQRIAGVSTSDLLERIHVAAGHAENHDPEKLPTLRQVIVAAFSVRWQCSITTVRTFIEPTSNRHRRPTATFPKFFEDLAKYGGAKFDERGKLLKETLGRGPGPIQFFGYTKGGADAPPRRRRAQ